MKKTTYLFMIITALSALAVSGCQGASSGENGTLTASGTLAADEIRIASEISGTLKEVLVSEGDPVSRGDVLFTIDDSLFLAEKNRAEKALASAQAGLAYAQQSAASAAIQYQLTSQQAGSGERAQTAQGWRSYQPEKIDLPGWYFQKSEQLEAVQEEASSAEERLSRLQSDLEGVLTAEASQEFLAIEKDLHASQVAYEMALNTLDKAKLAADSAYLQDAAQENYDAAAAVLESAQLDYDREISAQEAEAILEARAQVAAAQSDLDYVLDRLTSLQTGEDSLQVEAARAGVELAEAGVSQARAGVEEAIAALEALGVQQEKMATESPLSGVVLALNAREGEIIAAGSTLLTIASLEELELTVYVSEVNYGRIDLGQEVALQVDSFPGESFNGRVVQIADEAEFTPRNVQTAEGRKTTVFAVKIQVQNPEGKLKPGMPADVSFE